MGKQARVVKVNLAFGVSSVMEHVSPVYYNPFTLLLIIRQSGRENRSFRILLRLKIVK